MNDSQNWKGEGPMRALYLLRGCKIEPSIRAIGSTEFTHLLNLIPLRPRMAYSWHEHAISTPPVPRSRAPLLILLVTIRLTVNKRHPFFSSNGRNLELEGCPVNQENRCHDRSQIYIYGGVIRLERAFNWQRKQSPSLSVEPRQGGYGGRKNGALGLPYCRCVNDCGRML